jgi:lysophospholipase L1-like esterase
MPIRPLRALAAAVSFVSLGWALSNAPAAVAQGVPKVQPPPLRLMPVGDSITEGGDGAGGFRRPLFDLITAATGHPPNLVGARNMRQSDPADFVDPDEDGYSAYRIEQIASGRGFWKADPIEQRLRDWDPALVTIHAGTNDAQQDYYFDGDPDLGIPSAIDRLDALVTRVVRWNPDIYVIVAQIIPANAPASQTTQDYIVRLNALIPAMVAKHQANGERVSMVDLYTPMLPYPNPDGIHPSTEGYHVMANVWFAGIQALGVIPQNPDPGRFAGVHQVDRWSTVTSTPWTLSPNLVRAGSSTLASAETVDYAGAHSPDLLNDGSLATFSDDHDHVFKTTFTLNTDSAPNGYDITEIRTDAGRPIADNGDEQAEQAYEIWVRGADHPTKWKHVGNFHHIMVNRIEKASQVDLTSLTPGQPMLSHVVAIQFRFKAPPRRQFGFYGIDTGTPYREIEVLGAPSAP